MEDQNSTKSPQRLSVQQMLSNPSRGTNLWSREKVVDQSIYGFRTITNSSHELQDEEEDVPFIQR